MDTPTTLQHSGLLVSIILPTRNERAWIAKSLDSVLEEISDRQDLEVLCVDGMSTDGTRDIISGYASGDPRVRLIDNPRRTLPNALNVGIRHSAGKIILRMDCHATCGAGYVAKNVELLQRSGAECVGGYLATLPGADTPVAKAIAAALSSTFGVGGCRSRTSGGKEEESDEATFGCFPRELFDRIGMFDERLTRNQDMEFFCRIRSRGGRIVISPEIQVTYYSRTTYDGLRRQAFGNGLWGAYTVYLVGGGLRPRHLIPMVFVLSLLVLGLGGLAWWPLWGALAIEMVAYLASGAFMAVKTAGKTRTSAFLIWLAFIQLHIAYGLGTLCGLLSAPFRFGRGRGGAMTAE